MVASSRLTRAAPPAPRPGSVRQANLVRPRRCLLDPHRAAEAGQRSLGNDADAPRLAGRLRVRAAGRGPADSGALRARRGSHSDEIPVRVQRHQPASAFLLPSQIETEGGGREVGEKKKADQKGREEKPRRCSGLTPSSLLLHSPEARRSGPPPRRDPALRLRAGRAPRLCRGKQGLIKLERNFSQLLMNRRLGSRPSPPSAPVLPLRHPGPPPSPLSFLLGLCSGLEVSGLRSEPACGGGAGPSQPGRAAALSAQPSWAPGRRCARGPGALARGCSAFSLSQSFFFPGGIFFFSP